MTVSREEKKIEAIVRMKKWGIYSKTIEQFKNDNLISESAPPLGACYWIEGEQLARVREFECQHNALVYFVIHSYTSIGELENYLYGSDYPEEWEQDREDIGYGQQFCYVLNHDMPDCSEFGSIGVALTGAAGLRRTWGEEEQTVKITVEHEVPYTPGNENRCLYPGDFWGNEVCRYHKHRDRTHGRKAPTERKVPKCVLFDTWLSGDYVRCEKCREAIKAAMSGGRQDG